jgi:hypothetical protein
MPFDNSALIPLVSNSGFTIWLYRTTDSRATALTTGYFAAASTRLATGDVMFLQASDTLTLTTIRPGTVIAAGLVVDTSATPFRAARQAHQRFSVMQAVSAVAMTLLLAPLAGGVVVGGTVQAQAAVAGPIAEVAFSIRDAAGTTVRGPQAAAVSAGSASATLPAPDAGTGYRLRVEAVGFPAIADTSAAFGVSQPFALLAATDVALLLEDGSRLLLA